MQRHVTPLKCTSSISFDPRYFPNGAPVDFINLHEEIYTICIDESFLKGVVVSAIALTILSCRQAKNDNPLVGEIWTLPASYYMDKWNLAFVLLYIFVLLFPI